MLLLLAAAAAAQIANATEGNLSLSSNLSVNASVFSPPDQLDVGVNLSPLTTDGYGVTEWAITSTRVFRDLFKHATPWARERAAFVNGERTETWKSFGLGQGALAVNLTFANGYPSSLPRWGSYGTEQRQSVVAYVGRGGAHVAGGQYAVHFDGNGTLGFAGDASEAGFSYSPEARRGRYLVDVSPAGGVELRVLSTDAADPLHNIRMVRVSDEVRDATGAVDVNATDAALRARPFHEDLLETLRGVRILRFCGWALIDNNDWHDNNFLPAWEGRTTPDSLTQAGPRGVALEYMVALANEVNASAWFCMPRTDAMASDAMVHPNRPGQADQADLQAYAAHVRATLAPHLSVFVEYRTDASSRNEAPQTHAIESLEVWRAWSAAFEPHASRLTRVSAAGAWLPGTLSRFGSDIARLDAVALRAAFGTLCPYGTLSRYNKCVNFDDAEEAAEHYANWTVEQLLDKVEEAALHAEAELHAEVQLLHQRGIRVMSDWGGADLRAASYGARATLSGAARCEDCHRTARGNKYGTAEFAARAAAAADGYVVAEQWLQMYGYEGLSTAARAYVDVDEAGAPSYWRHVGADVAACVGVCDAAAQCAGFAHQRSLEWSCGARSHATCPGGPPCYDRYGNCTEPGTCYFFSNKTAGAARHIREGDCGATFPEVRVCARDVYWKGQGAGAAPHLLDDAAAGAACAGSCRFFYRGEAKELPAEQWSLDLLAANRSAFTRAAALEQQLEARLLEAGAHPRMREIFLDFLERWRRLGGRAFVAQPLYRPPVLCATGGKSCGHAALMLGPDDGNASKVRAVREYNLGARSLLPFTAADARAAGLSPPPAACAPPCVWGACVRGGCACFAGAEGEACDRLSAGPPQCAAAADGGGVGINLAGIYDWSRAWAYVDVFRAARAWCLKLIDEYNCRAGIEPPLELDPAIGGYPARLAPGQAACAMMLRDLETHYLSGVYTVLYEGDGTLTFSLNTDYVRRVRAGVIEVDVTLTTGVNNGVYLCIARTNEDDPVRRIRVMSPGYAASGALDGAEPEFHPLFVHQLRRYRHLRFMDWARANDEEGGSPTGEWADRAREGDAARVHSYAMPPGVPYESMVRLSNTVGADPWITLPHRATDDFALQLARLLNATLRPDLSLTVSLSNEMWHSGFAGGQYAELRGFETGLGRTCWYVNRTIGLAQVMRPWLDHGGRRARFVVEAQAVSVDSTAEVLRCLSNSTLIDAVAIAPYFDGYDPALADLPAVLDAYDAALNATLELVGAHAALVAAYGYQLYTYEAGPAGQGNGTAQDLAIAAHRDPAMREMVRRYYLGLRAAGVALLMHFTSVSVPSIYGNFGLLEAADQDPRTAPKHQGLHDVIDATCGADDAADAACAEADACGEQGYCLAPHLRWGERDTQECACYFAYSGANCSVFTPIVYQSCGYRCTFDQGTCAVSGVFGPNQYWSCTACHPLHFGATCSRFRCENDCHGRGHCLDANVCSCLRGYDGETCEHDCGCGGHGQCRPDGTCICDVGWRARADGGCEWDCDTADVANVGCVGPGQSGCAACEYGDCVDGECRCWAGFAGAACTDAAPRPNEGSTFGLNLNSPGGANWVFVDLMKESRQWTSINDLDRYAAQFAYQDGGNSLVFTNRQYQWGNGLPLNLSGDGYPLELQEAQATITLAARDVCLHAIDGRYVLLYEGEGEIDLGMDATAIAFQSGRIDFDFKPTCDPSCWFDKAEWRPYCTDNGIALTIRRVNPRNPLRDIRLIAPGFLATHEILPFHPWFTRHVAHYSTLRFMDWAHTNRIPHSIVAPLRDVAAVRFNVSALRGPTPACARIGDLYLFHAGQPVPVASAYDARTGDELPDLADGSEWSDECASISGESASVVLALHAPSALDAYAWRTSHQSRTQDDPVRWTVEGLVRGEWLVFDRRDLFDQPVTVERRRAALDAMLTTSNLQFVGQERGVAADFLLQATASTLEWSDRVTTAHRSQSEDGVALEYMLALANQVGAAPWFCVHHLASDDYVRQMATLVRDTLRPDVKIYVEHSNEVWNGFFPQGEYSRRRGIELGLHQSNTSQNECAHFAPVDVCASIRYHVKRSLEIFSIWREVFGDTARQSRLRFVLATHTGYGSMDYHTELLTYLNAHQTIDLFSTTCYMSTWPVGPAVDTSFVQYSPTQIHALMTPSAPGLAARLRQIADVAAGYGVATTVYEGGPSLVQDGVIEGGTASGAVTEGLIAANRHPGMGGVLDAFFDALERNASTVFGREEQPFMYFAGPSGTYSKYGSWGMQEFTDQPLDDAPKYRAVARRIRRHTDAAGIQLASRRCVTASLLHAAVPLGDVIEPSGAYLQRFSGPPAVDSPRLGDQLVAGQRYAITWRADARRRNESELVTVELWQHADCNGTASAVLAAAIPNGGKLSFVPNATGSGFFVRISALGRPSVNYSEPFSVVHPDDAPAAFALYIERDVDLLSAYHRDCKKDQTWAIVPHFKIDSCTYSSEEGCRAYRTARSGGHNFGQWNELELVDGAPTGVLHGWGKLVLDCTLHVIGVRATMQLEGLTRGFDPSAADAVAKVIGAEAKVPPESVQLVNVRTVSGFATFFVSDCRRTDCFGRRRLQASSSTEETTAYAFDVSISSNDAAVDDILTLLTDLQQPENSTYFAYRLAGELSSTYDEDVQIAVRAVNVSTTEAYNSSSTPTTDALTFAPTAAPTAAPSTAPTENCVPCRRNRRYALFGMPTVPCCASP